MRATLTLVFLAACAAPSPTPLDAQASGMRLVSSSGSALRGATDAGATFGWSAAGLGDVDGDGFEDVAVGAPGDNGGTGRVYVFHGAALGLGPSSLTLAGDASGDEYGYSVAGVGDVNGDGFDDLLVGAPGATSEAGRAYLYLGSASGLGSTASVTVDGVSAGDRLGQGIGSLRDTNGDGFADFGIGSPGAGSGRGSVSFYLGAAKPTGSAVNTVAGDAGAAFGSAMAGADVNGDGYAEAIVGGPSYNYGAGRVYAYPGTVTGPRGAPTATLDGDGAGAAFGSTISFAGDLNGDTYEDVLIGSYGHDSSNGRAEVFPGTVAGLSSISNWFTDGSAAAELGRAIAGGRDFDGDGHPDVAIGHALATSATGEVLLFPGNGTVFTPAASDILTGLAVSDQFGYALAAADVNGDGATDLVVGAPQVRGGVGAAFAYTGASSVDGDGDGYPASTDCNDSDPLINPGVPELPGNRTDEDCDDAILCFADGDDDGFADLGGAVVPSDDMDCDDPSEANDRDPRDDCDDRNPDTNPRAIEQVGNEQDNDCDGGEICFTDLDDDGWRPTDESVTVESKDADCQDAGEAAEIDRRGDCDDEDAGVNPSMADDTVDGVDQDCDGTDGGGDDTGDDTGDTGGDTGETGDTGGDDTGETGGDDTGDTGGDDTGETDGDDTGGGNGGDDTGGDKAEGGCGCASTDGADGGPAALALLLAGAALARRRAR